MIVLRPEEARALLYAAAHTPHEALVTVVLAVGLRKGEARWLRRCPPADQRAWDLQLALVSPRRGRRVWSNSHGA